MSADSKSIRLVTALVECRPDGEYVPWGIKWYDGAVYPFTVQARRAAQCLYSSARRLSRLMALDAHDGSGDGSRLHRDVGTACVQGV